MKRKGQMVGNMVTLIVGVSVAVLVLIFIGVMAGRTFENQEDALAEIGNNAVTNEVILNVTNATAFSLNHGFIQDDSVVNFTDTTNATVVTKAGNFTFANDQYTLVNGLYSGANFTLNYTWGVKDIRDKAQDSILAGFDSLKETAEFTPLIVLAVIITLVLFVVLGVTGLTGVVRGGGGGATL